MNESINEPINHSYSKSSSTFGVSLLFQSTHKGRGRNIEMIDDALTSLIKIALVYFNREYN